jgi:hypothetical protein
MMHAKTNSNMLLFFYKPLFAVLMLLGLFSLIWLRSHVVKTAYDLRNLEVKKMEALKDMKMLLAERARLMSLEKVNASFKGKIQAGTVYASNNYIFPDRAKVVHIKRNGKTEALKASLEIKK